MSARVVYAVRYAPDVTSPVKMFWRCSCGGDGVDVPGAQLACPSCGQTVRIPEQPTNAPVYSPGLVAGAERAKSNATLTAGVEQQTSTAWKLAAYREELHACGFAPSVAADLVLIAARNATEWTVGALFLVRAEPAAPIMWIENHEPGSPLDLAIRKRFGPDGDGR